MSMDIGTPHKKVFGPTLRPSSDRRLLARPVVLDHGARALSRPAGHSCNATVVLGLRITIIKYPCPELRSIPVDTLTVQEFERPGEIPERELDVCIRGWSATARLRSPDVSEQLTAINVLSSPNLNAR